MGQLLYCNEGEARKATSFLRCNRLNEAAYVDIATRGEALGVAVCASAPGLQPAGGLSAAFTVTDHTRSEDLKVGRSGVNILLCSLGSVGQHRMLYLLVHFLRASVPS